MAPVSGIQSSSSPALSQAVDLLSAMGDPTSSAFLGLVGRLLGPARTAPKSSALPPGVIQAQERIMDFERKLALLSGMAQQAQIAMNGQAPLPGGLPSPAAQEYYLAKSELARVGLPGVVNEVV